MLPVEPFAKLAFTPNAETLENLNGDTMEKYLAELVVLKIDAIIPPF